MGVLLGPEVGAQSEKPTSVTPTGRQAIQAVGTKTPEPEATATIDRLAAPPTVENPTQADEGAQLYWLHCQPCHGDVGQGLTDEWRAQYPPEDQNCWMSGCHGRRPYEEGFTLPDSVPAVVGEGSLDRFLTMAEVFSFMRAAMPFQDPGHLSEEEYLAISAFLAREHGLWDGRRLTPDNAATFRLKPESASVSPESTRPATDESTSPVRERPNHNRYEPPEIALVGGAVAFLLAAGGFWLWRRSVK